MGFKVQQQYPFVSQSCFAKAKIICFFLVFKSFQNVIAQLLLVQVLVHPVNACSSTGAQVQVQVQVLEHARMWRRQSNWSPLTVSCPPGFATI